ncbi:ACRO protein, partial [Pachycephala philippinensis]|nr:ACRO protein [Pachycephala philippinensis]
VEVRRIKRLIMHEDYVRDIEHNDIALLELDRPVQCSSTIQLACLPDPTLRVSELKNCYIAGWGDRIVKSSGRDILQQAKVQLVDNKLCNSSEWLHGYINDFNVCSGQGGIGTCQGDSGGPVVCQDKYADFFWQIGVTSWGIGCARPKRPSVSTSTQYYYNWIQAKIR